MEKAKLRLAVVSVAAGIMTAGLPAMREANRSMCDRCRGKGFDRFTANRSARKCPRCKGEGSIAVGNTKR